MKTRYATSVPGLATLTIGKDFADVVDNIEYKVIELTLDTTV